MMKKLLIFLFALGGISIAHAQVQTGAGSVWYGPFPPPYYGAGAYESYNAASAGESDFFSVGTTPGFYWYELGSGASLPGTPNMKLSGTTLTVAQVNGNAATAAALAATPTQCPAGETATGIAANGNANCVYRSQIGTGAGCAFASDGNGLTCTTTVTLSPGFADTNYKAVCVPQFSSAVATTTSAMPSMGLSWSISSGTAINIDEALNNGASTGWGISSSYGVTIYCTVTHN